MIWFLVALVTYTNTPTPDLKIHGGLNYMISPMNIAVTSIYLVIFNDLNCFKWMSFYFFINISKLSMEFG